MIAFLCNRCGHPRDVHSPACGHVRVSARTHIQVPCDCDGFREVE